MHERGVYIELIGLPIICLLLAPSDIVVAQSNSSFLTYTNIDDGFTLQYPHDWYILEDESKSKGITLILASPDRSGLVMVKLQSFSAQELPAVESMALDKLVNYFLGAPADGTNIVELNAEGYLLSGHPAGRIVVTSPVTSPTTGETYVSKMMALATIVEGRLYVVSYAADTRTYNRYLPDGQTIMDTFQVIKKQ